MEIEFPRSWVGAREFENLLATQNPACETEKDIRLSFPKGCALLIDSALKTLSLANQLVSDGKNVATDFRDDGLLGYLDRMGFFDALAPQVTVLPRRPIVSAHSLYFGGNHQLVEISVLNPGREVDAKDLPGKLADRIASVLGFGTASNDDFVAEMFTVFSELIGNYFEHSESDIPGYVVAQTYAKTNSVWVAISDSGLGITHTIRRDRPKDFRDRTDPELLIDVFNEGISRHGDGTGRSCGLYRCGQISLKHSANLRVRTPSDQVYLRPGRTRLEKNKAFYQSELGHLRGTHLCFEFTLDKS
ncbi:MAG: ATP-binding protein [Elusimicrobia bacterium]|nr:ATP-binding protein [Elusimicrobiota bacterium]